ncbi:MAG: O-antigen ligase family protein [Bacteroidota bacterium]
MPAVVLAAALTVCMALSPRAFLFVSTVLGTVMVSKFEYLLGVEGMDGNMLRNISTNVAGVLLLGRAALAGRTPAVMPSLRPFLLLVGLSVAGVPFAPDLTEGMRFVSVLTIPLLVYGVASVYFRPEDYAGVFGWLTAAGIAQVAAGFAETVWVPGTRVAGLHDVPAVYGWFFCVLIIVSTFYAGASGRGRGAPLFFLLAGAVLVVLTGSRVALVMFPASLWYFLRRYPLRKDFLLPLALVPLVAGALVLSHQLDTGRARVGLEMESAELSLVGEAGGTLAWRFMLWERLMEAWTGSPVLGFGPGADYAASLRGGLTSDLNYAESEPLNTHNEYVKLLFNHGVAGLGLFLWFAVGLLRTPRLPDPHGAPGLGRVIRFLALTWLVFSLSDNGLSYHGMTSILFLCLARWTCIPPSGLSGSDRRGEPSRPG